MKRLLLLLWSVVIVMMATAADVTPAQALQNAREFVQKRTSFTSGPKRAHGTVPQMTQTQRVNGLYVFNMSKGGFVVVSNDDRTRPILGFSDSGTFDPDNIPANMKAWLKGYADEIAWLEKQETQSGQSPIPTNIRRRVGSHSTTAIAPLVSTTWNQDVPFNNLCPEYSSGNRSATGCVATAMAQVMKYHQWPEAATTAIPGYTTDSYDIDLTAGLTATTFDWANMLDSYSGSYSDDEAAAVATLMQYCGYSVEMDYGPESGSSSDMVAAALKNYFDYNSTTQIVSRSMYTAAKWADLIYHELANNRPVVYGGMSSGGGHEFVCDGYKNEDNTDFFHINWGWGGLSDDYFVLSALDPDEQGIGGSTSNDGFHYGQDAVIGIQPSIGTGTIADVTANVVDLTVNSMTLSSSTVTAGLPVDITLNVTNNSTDDYDGDVFFGIAYEGNYYPIDGNNFSIPAGETVDCVITYTTPPGANTMDLVWFLPNASGSYSTDGTVMATLEIVTRTTNNRVPVYALYCDNLSRSQFIIPAADLQDMLYANLNGVTFYSNSTSAISWGDAEFDVYLSEVNETTLSELKDWNSLEKVYAGSLSIAANGQMAITFDTPYQYMGDNLLVGVNQTIEGNFSQCSWVGREATGASLGGYNSNISQQNFLPAYTFDYTPGEAPAVARPTGLTVSYEGGTEAVVSWTSTESAWDIDVNGTVTENVTNPYTLTGLELATVYTVKVRAKNGSDVSDWSPPVTFNTDLSEEMCHISLELTDGYGDGWNGAAIQVVDVLTGIVIGTVTNSTNDHTNAPITDTTILRVPAGRDIQFVWVSGSYNDECSYVVYDVNGEEIFSGSGAMGSAVTYHVDCTVTPWRTPTGLAASEIGPHSAQLSWTENGAATAWVVGYKADSEADFTEVNTTTNPFTLTGLAAETEYTVKVRPVSDDGTIKWSKTITFTTNTATPVPTGLTVTPAPTTADATWAGFADSYDVRYVPLPATGYGSDWLQYDNGTYKENTGTSSSSTWTWGVMYPAVTGNRLTKVSFYENASYNTNDIIVNIYAGDTPSDTPLYSEVVTPMGTSGFHEVTLATPVEITPNENLWIALTTTGTYVIPYCVSNEPNNNWIYYEGTLIHLDVLNSLYAGYGWMIRGYFESTTDPESLSWTEGTSAEGSYTMTGLTPETDYLLQVRGDFGSEGKSEWATTTFTTPSQCDAPNTLAFSDITHNTATITWTGYQDSYNLRYKEYSPDLDFVTDFDDSSLDGWTTIDADGDGYGWEIYSTDTKYFSHAIGTGSGHNGSADRVVSGSYSNVTSSALTPDNYLVSPQLNLGGTITFWAYGHDDTYFAEHFGVAVSTTGNTNAADFTTVQEWTMNAGKTWKQFSVDLSAYNGQTGYIAIRHFNCTDEFVLGIDDIVITQPDDDIPWTTVENISENRYELTGLAAQTDYKVQVQGINDACGITDWSEVSTFTTLNVVVLSDTDDNSETVTSYAGQTVNVCLDGRTLYKDGSWNTLCLPFDVDLTADGCPLAGASARELTSATITGNTLNLTFSADVDLMTAGVPYIIMWADGDDIVNPVFTNVEVKDELHSAEFTDVDFVGSYAPVVITETDGDNTIFYLGSDNKLYWPDAPMTIGAQRAIFSLKNGYFGVNTGNAAKEINSFNIDFGDGATGIISIDNGKLIIDNAADGWYSLDGVRLKGKPAMKGVYINNGRKVVVK